MTRLPEKYRYFILYSIFGILTTIVDLAIYYLLVNLTALHYLIAQVIGWIAAVLFSYATNRKWVFFSDSHGFCAFREMLRFMAGRLFSLAVQSICLYVLVDLVHWHENIARLPVLVIVTVLNYVSSKLFVFDTKPSGD